MTTDTTVTLMRRVSGFVNVSDGFVVPTPGTVGRYDEHDGWREERYLLPDGYSFGKANDGDYYIFGLDRFACEIIEHRPTGRPQIAGGPVLKAAE